MAAPLLGLVSLLGREYANSQPTVKQRDDILKVLSPQTYYGDQLIQYLANKFSPTLGSGLKDAQVLSDQYAVQPYYENRPENRLSEEEYDQQMAELSAQVNRPGNLENFEDRVRDMDYGTLNQNVSQYVGPLEEYDQTRLDTEYDFANSLSDFQPGLNSDVSDLGEMTITDQKSSDYQPAPTSNFLQTVMAPPVGVDSNKDFLDNLNGNISSPVGASSDSVGFTTPPSMPDYSRAYSALGGAELVSNLRDQLLGMGISEDIIGSAFSAYYAPETSNEGIKSIFSQDGYRNGGFLNRGGR
jgi:hypothetical protein